MTVCIVYFEKNKHVYSEVPHQLYNEVNHYIFPKNLLPISSINLFLNGKEIKASEFSGEVCSKLYDFSGHGRGRGEEARVSFLSFLFERLTNPCVQPMIYIFIDDNSNQYADLPREITTMDVHSILSEIFEKKQFSGLFEIANG